MIKIIFANYQTGNLCFWKKNISTYGCDGYWRFWSELNKCKNRQSNPHIRYYKMGRNYMTIMICVGCFMSVSVRYSDIVLNMGYPTKC